MAVLLKYPLHCLLRSLASMSYMYDPLSHIHLLVICKLYRYSLSSLTEHKSLVHWRLLTSQKKHPWSCIWIFTWAWNKRGKRLKTLLMNLRLVQGWVIYSGLGIILLVQFSEHSSCQCVVLHVIWARHFLLVSCYSHSAVHELFSCQTFTATSQNTMPLLRQVINVYNPITHFWDNKIYISTWPPWDRGKWLLQKSGCCRELCIVV